MGASQSTNIAKVTLDAVTDVSTSIIQNSTTTTNQQQGIVIKAGKNVKVGNITQKTTATVNTKNLMKAMSTTSAQQDLTEKLSQAATSITSGINFAQYSNAYNEINNTVNETLNVATNIQNTCVGQVNNQQTITIDAGDGTQFGNISQESVSNIFQDCITNAVTSSDAVQTLQATLDQSATAKSEGLSAFGIALIIGMIILAITVPVVVGGTQVVNSVLKLFFPIMIVAGLVLIFLYFTWKTDASLVTKFSEGLSQSTDCDPSGAIVSQKVYNTFKEAHDAFQANDSYVAMDWVGYGPTSGGRLGPKLPQPKTTFYTNMANPDCNVPVDQNVQLFTRPTFRSGKGVPSNTVGDAGDYYLNIETGQTYFKVKQQWNLQSGTVSTDNQPVTFGNSLPSGSLKPGAYYMDTSNPKSLTLYKGGESQPVKENIPGPGYVVSNPEFANMSAIKFKGDRPVLLWIGGAAVTMGFVGFILTTIFGPKKGAASKAPVKASKN